MITCTLYLIGVFPLILSAIDNNFRNPFTSSKENVADVHSPDQIAPESNLRDYSKKIWIITTAALPWLTGTAVNPLLRAAHLAKDRPKGKITLMVPWLPPEEQHLVFPKHFRFDSPNEQRTYMRDWLHEKANLDIAAENLELTFYAARYLEEYHSVFPIGDITAMIPDDEADICILEEPEHLNWLVYMPRR